MIREMRFLLLGRQIFSSLDHNTHVAWKIIMSDAVNRHCCGQETTYSPHCCKCSVCLLLSLHLSLVEVITLTLVYSSFTLLISHSLKICIIWPLFFLIAHTLLCWTLNFLKLRITVANIYWELKHYKLLRAFYVSLVFCLPLSNSLRNTNIFIIAQDKGTYSNSLAEREHKPMFLNHWTELLPWFTLLFFACYFYQC